MPTNTKPSGIDFSSTTRCIDAGLKELDPRALDIVARRYGISTQGQSLQEIGNIYRVSRERIRQIQAKSLRILRHFIRERLVHAISTNSTALWRTLATNEEYVVVEELGAKTKSIPGEIRLALDICEMDLESWLNEYARPVSGGWFSPELSIGEFSKIQDHLKERVSTTALPITLEVLAGGEVNSTVRAAIALSGLHFYGSYVAGKSSTKRFRRAMRLHVILGRLGGIQEILDLHREYRASTPSDSCSPRDCELVMSPLKHLFVEVMEGNWSAIGPSGSVPEEIAADRTGTKVVQTQISLPKTAKEPKTVHDSIVAELMKRGPCRISELIRGANEFLPEGRSENSIAPILLTRKDTFCRPLPGVYALLNQLPTATNLLESPPSFLLREDQIRTYALARRAGEPWGAYPLWLPETEYVWCVWARKHADSRLLESLLSVVQIEDWPQVDDKEKWRQIARLRGKFSIQFSPSPNALVPPDLNRLLAACIYLRQHGYLGWISGNRILGRRAPEHLSAGLLAILVALKVLSPNANDWQARHRPGAQLNRQYKRLEAIRMQTGHIDWNTSFGRMLESEVLETKTTLGWVSPELIDEIFARARTKDSGIKSMLSPLDQLLAERSKLGRTIIREKTLRNLLGPDTRPQT